MSMFQVTFALTVVLTAGLWYVSRDQRTTNKTSEFALFQRNYLTVYLLAMFADWLQGPYVYKLYSEYGFDQEAIAQLFIGGFVSSLVVGTIVGSLADKYGRKMMCMVFSLCYIASALTKLVNSYWVLMLGRILSGVATSLLFSSFEAWMVCEHNARGFDPELLGNTFGIATLGNGIVAVGAGLTAEAVASAFGSVGPFLFAVGPLVALLVIVYRFWPENYGDSSMSAGLSFRKAVTSVASDQRILCLGVAQACFEGAMYTFVFMWNPALDPQIVNGHGSGAEAIPLGLIFATFMVCMMAGSFAFSYLNRTGNIMRLPLKIHWLAAIAMGVVAIAAGPMGIQQTLFGMFDQQTLIYVSFLVFEFCCGLFFPTYGTIRSSVIPEQTRAAIMNLFRMPLNGFVVLLLLKVKFLPMSIVFFICMGAHVVSFLLYWRFSHLTPEKAYSLVEN